MSLVDFIEKIDEKKEYQYKIFVYGNWTKLDNLESDSYTEVIKNVIDFLSQRYSVHFTLNVPRNVTSFDKFENVDQVIWPLPTYPNQMRTHFDSDLFMKSFDWKRNEFDIIYSHLPEHTAQIANCIYNNTHFRPKIIGYSHWFEIPESTDYEKTMFLSSMAGILEMDECGVNSNWLKQRILAEAIKYFNDDVIRSLDKKIQPHYLGTERIISSPSSIDIVRNQFQLGSNKKVIFNHRLAGYTGWGWFVEAMDILWKKRQDFTVYTTLGKIDRPWCQMINAPNRDEYMTKLLGMKFGVACFEKYSAWSLSVTDGLSVGIPYLLPKKLCYPEMMKNFSDYPYFYSTREEFLVKFERMLDDAVFTVNPTDYTGHWSQALEYWFGKWNNVFDLSDYALKSKTDKFNEIVDFIKQRGYVSKKELMDFLGWGVHIKWTPYRNLLRKEENIRFTKNGYEYIKT